MQKDFKDFLEDNLLMSAGTDVGGVVDECGHVVCACVSVCARVCVCVFVCIFICMYLPKNNLSCT